MFWRFGGYANISTLDTILDKPDVTLEELLDESDLIQELKQHNSKLIEYLRDENALRRLLEYVVAPPTTSPGDEDEDREDEDTRKMGFSPVRSLSMGRKSKEQIEKAKKQEAREESDKADKTRQKYAYIACEVLSSETWSILEALMENQQHVRHFWEFLRQEAPLDPTAASYFTKINETLLDKKTEETLEFVKSLDGIIPAMLQHVDCPMVMDLLLKIISMEKAEGGQGIVDWLQSQNLMPLLLAYLARDYPSSTQTSAGDFIKAIITISANASQNEQSCIGPNSLTRQLVSEICIESLITNMLRGGNPLTVGVGIIIEVIRKNNSDYDPDVSAGHDLAPSSSDPIYLGTLLRLFAKHVPDFTELILSPNHTVPNGDSTMTIKRKDLRVAFGSSIEPLGFDRFKTCELMAELLHCSNMGLLNERGSEAFVWQRDQEREKLKAEGSLAMIREPRSAVTDFSEDSTGYRNGQSPLRLGSGSPEGIRKLEVANSADEDGFEDVGASADLADDIKDDFDEKSPFELETNTVQPASLSTAMKPRLDLDEEFVDEPLTSPRLEAVDEKEAEVPDSSESLELHSPEPISPTPASASGVEDLNLDNDSHVTTGRLDEPEKQSGTDDLVDAITSQLAPHVPSSDAPPLPHRDRFLDATATDSSVPTDPSSRQDDKPAPLFAARSEDIPPIDESMFRPSEQEISGGNSQETIDTTLGEEGDSVRSVLVGGNDQSFAPHIESDVDGQPLVGDFLKIMFVEHRVVPTILDFFFRFPWNNFLHNVVYDVVQQVFNGPMDRGYNRSLAIDLFQTGRITERIVEGQQRSDEAQKKNNMRLGYMGHLTLIAEEVVKFSDRHPPELLSHAVLNKVTSKQWSDYVENTLAETRERDNAILGGVRPDMSVGPRQAVLNAVNAAHNFGNASSALANAGLNGGNANLDSMDLANNDGASSGTFGLNSGGSSLLSGFGSSSDEDDEEMGETEEHEGGGGGASDQYPSYTPTSLSALSLFSSPLPSPTHPASTSTNTTNVTSNLTSNSSSSSFDPTATGTSTVPSIPPPLNIPPSRARRQLAARLALHGKGSGTSTSPLLSLSPSQDQNQQQQQQDRANNDNNDNMKERHHQQREATTTNAVVNAAIRQQRSETPFGDLLDLKDMAASPRYGDDEDEDEDEEDEDEVWGGAGLRRGGGRETSGRRELDPGRDENGNENRNGYGPFEFEEGDGNEDVDADEEEGEEGDGDLQIQEQEEGHDIPISLALNDPLPSSSSPSSSSSSSSSPSALASNTSATNPPSFDPSATTTATSVPTASARTDTETRRISTKMTPLFQQEGDTSSSSSSSSDSSGGGSSEDDERANHNNNNNGAEDVNRDHGHDAGNGTTAPSSAPAPALGTEATPTPSPAAKEKSSRDIGEGGPPAAAAAAAGDGNANANANANANKTRPGNTAPEKK